MIPCPENREPVCDARQCADVAISQCNWLALRLKTAQARIEYLEAQIAFIEAEMNAILPFEEAKAPEDRL